MLRAVGFLVLGLLWCPGARAEPGDSGCYTPGSVAGIVIGTVVVTLVMGGLAAAFARYLWKQRKGMADEKPLQKSIPCPPMTPEKLSSGTEANDYAFDNPYFKDDETLKSVGPDAAEKGEAGFHVDNGDIRASQNAQAPANGSTHGKNKKSRPFSSLPFHVFHPSSGKKHRATMDDTYISKHLERITVPLRGHDFTGLGFNICGNMRDGIFVKDVLHRGPASESGKIKAGDRIVGVTVSFSAMVYEDALTILSYASPYDVKLEIEKGANVATNVSQGSSSSSSSPKKLGTSTSFRSCGQRRLFHPLYRSQSIDDLTQIGKDSFLVSSNKGSPRDTNSITATPKRSQSVEVSNATSKTRSVFNFKPSEIKSRKSSTSSDGSTDKKTAPSPVVEAPSEPPSCNEVVECKEKVEAKEEDCRVHAEDIKCKSEAPPPKPARESSEDKSKQLTIDGIQETVKATTSSDNEAANDRQEVVDVDSASVRPYAPPRKTNVTPVKRRAPAPPPAKTETAAVVHRSDESTTTDEEPVPANSNDGSKAEEEPASPNKRKAASLGDLTKLDHDSGKATASISPVLERAVSLDLQQQSMPGENLTKQKKILHAPAFEDDDGEDVENVPDGLKRWDEGLDKVLIGLTNGNKLSLEQAFDKALQEINDDNNNPQLSDEPPPREVLTLDFEFDSSSGEMPPPDVAPQKPPLDDNDIVVDMDADVPYLASSEKDTSFSSPVTISIPVIKPDLTQFEKLPSPPSQHPAWRISKTPSFSEDKSPLYRPVFAKLVNGNDAEQDHSEATPKAPSSVAGFAKTLIVPDGDNLLDSEPEPAKPPPTLDPPPKPVETE